LGSTASNCMDPKFAPSEAPPAVVFSRRSF
jgi:hypothetical protein